MPAAFLLHEETETVWEIPTGKTRIYLGKRNQKIKIDLDFSELPDSSIISRVHAIVHVERDGFYLEDVGSLNGTSINGELLQDGRMKLHSGDRITFGSYQQINLLFEIESAEETLYHFQSLADE